VSSNTESRNAKSEPAASDFAFRSSDFEFSMNVDFDKAGGLVPVIAQDADSGEVLMLAWMDRAAYEETLRTGRACYYSRSRRKLWRKGEESGHVQEVKEIYVDCDADTILLKVHQVGGAACHEGYRSCFFRRVDGGSVRIIGQRVFDPEQVYRK
jgi:phosphoribosyl-AMP cyclohydrolase